MYIIAFYEVKIVYVIYTHFYILYYTRPDAQSQMRYTEQYLSPFTIDLLGDLIECKDVVDWDYTFDRRTMEPLFLPVKVPLLLINGTFAISVGLRVEVPPHSINDVVDVTLRLMDDPNAKVTLIPDPCQKCEIVDTDWGKISRNGFGYFTERGIIEILQGSKGEYVLAIKSTPDLIWANSIVERIEELIKTNKIIQIADIQDHSRDDQLDIRLILKKGADPTYVKQVLYKNTALEHTKRVNMQVIIDDEVKLIGYKTYLINFIETRRQVKFRLYNARLQKVETRLHTIEVFISILESGDVEKIIHAIRNQTASEESKLVQWLMNKLKITDLQAKYILNTEIKKLSKSNLNKYKDEQKRLKASINEYIDIITNPSKIDQDIRNELLEFKSKYGKPRQSVIISEAEASNIPSGTFKVILYNDMTIKKMDVNDVVRSYRGVSPKCVITGDNDKDILLFDEMGRVFKLPIHKIPFGEKSAAGMDIRLLLKKASSNIINIIYMPVIEELMKKRTKHFFISLTQSGLIKRIDLDDLISATPSGIIYSKLNEGDIVVSTLISTINNDIVIYTKTKAIRISIDSIPYLKRATLGNIAIKTSIPVDGMSIITKNIKHILVVTAKGYFNKIDESALIRQDRAKTGHNIIKLTKNDFIIGIYTCDTDGILRCYHTDGSITDIKDSDIGLSSSVSSGVKLTKEIAKAQLIQI